MVYKSLKGPKYCLQKYIVNLLGNLGEWPGGLRHCNQNWKVQTPLGAWLGLQTQPCYEAPSDLWAEYVKCSY